MSEIPEGRKGNWRPIAHGTEGGWRAHKRRNEEPCEECRQGARLTEKARKEGRKVPRRDPMMARREEAARQIREINRRDAETRRGAA